MGLITKEVEIRLNGKNVKYYEDLGYEIPRRYGKWGLSIPKGTTIKVKVEHLPKYSKVEVDIECDCCHRILHIPQVQYIKHNHDGKYFCIHCSRSVLVGKKRTYNYTSTKKQNKSTHNKNHSNHTNKRKNKRTNNKNNSNHINKRKNKSTNGRSYPEYIEFVRRVVTRDNYTCQCCGKKNKNLEVHHLDGYNWCVEKRTDETNGITLCESCHGNFHLIYGRGNNTKEQYEEWIGYAIGELEKYNGILPSIRKIYCVEEDKIYDSCTELMRKWNLKSDASIYEVCNHTKDCRVRNKHILWLDEYEQMPEDKKEEIHKIANEYIPYKNIDNINSGRSKKTVICVTTGEIFESAKEGKRFYNLSQGCDVKKCCQGRVKTSGKLPDGTPLRWMYYENFLKLPIEEQNKISKRSKDSPIDESFCYIKQPQITMGLTTIPEN